MVQGLSPIRRLLEQAQQDLDTFQEVVKKSIGEIPQAQIDIFFHDLAEHVKSLQAKANLDTFTAKRDADFESLEKRIMQSIDFLQKDARVRKCHGNLGNIQTAMSDFLNKIKEQMTSVKKKSKIQPVSNVENEQL